MNRPTNEDAPTTPAVKAYTHGNVQFTVEYSDFLPTQYLSDQINQELSDLAYFCPDQSKVNASFLWDNDACRVEINVDHSVRSFHSEATRINPVEASKKASHKLKHEIRQWRKERFGDSASYSRDLQIGKKLATPEPFPNMKVLLVDDDPISVRLIESCFRQQGCETMITTSGQDAIRFLQKMDCDLLVLDWFMPDVTGRDVIRKCDQNFIGRDHVKIPVLTYSMFGNQEIEFPKTEHFTRLGHIKKSLPYRFLKEKAIETLDHIKKYKQDTFKNVT